MDFIERIFDVSPDGGSGMLELTLIVAPVAFALLLRWARARARHAAR